MVHSFSGVSVGGLIVGKNVRNCSEKSLLFLYPKISLQYTFYITVILCLKLSLGHSVTNRSRWRYVSIWRLGSTTEAIGSPMPMLASYRYRLGIIDCLQSFQLPRVSGLLKTLADNVPIPLVAFRKPKHISIDSVSDLGAIGNCKSQAKNNCMFDHTWV